MLRNSLISITIGVLCLTSACSSPKRRLTVGAKSTTDQNVLAEILAQHIAAKTGIEVSIRNGLGMTATTHQALLMNEMDLYVETLGGLSAVVLKEQAEKDPGVALERVKGELERTAKVQILDLLGVDVPFAMIVRAKDAEERKVKTLSDAVDYKPGWDLVTTSDFQDRKDANTALVSAYRLPLKSVPLTRQPDEMYKLLQDGYISMVAGTVIDGQLGNPEFVALEDDKHAFQPAQLCVLVRDDTNQAFPELRGALAELKGKLTVELLRKLDYQVDVKHRQPKEVVADFFAGRIK